MKLGIWFFLCFSLMCFGCSRMPPEHWQLFQDAQSAFDAGEYQKAAALYEQLLDQEGGSGTIYYNLGNAWARADEPVRAIAAYYRAKRYAPNDPHLNANLSVVLTSNGGTIPPSESSYVSFLFFWQNWVGYHTKIWCSLVLTALTFFGGVLYLYRSSKRLKRYLTGAAVLTAIALASAGYDWYRFENIKYIVVTTNVLPRKGNSEQYELALITPISFGTPAAILDERSGWYFLRFPNGLEGWLPRSQTFPL